MRYTASILFAIPFALIFTFNNVKAEDLREEKQLVNNYNVDKLDADTIYSDATQIHTNYKNKLAVSIFAGQIGAADHIEEPNLFGIEIHFMAFKVYDLEIIPALGYAESGSGTEYTYLNFRHDYRLDDRWILTPMFGFGHFVDSHEIALGNEFEFVSGLELAYDFPGYFRVGLHVSHLSNAGISSTNPGTETISLSFTMPIRTN